VIVKPHFSSPRIDPWLDAAADAWRGRCGTTRRNSSSARVAIPPAPERPAEPVAHLALPVALGADGVARNRAVVHDRLHHDGVVIEDPLPMRDERRALPRRDSSHPRCRGIALLLVEDLEVARLDESQNGRHANHPSDYDRKVSSLIQ